LPEPETVTDTMSFNVLLIRHGESEANRKNLVHSYSAGGLTETGVKQAELLGKALANEKYTRAYSSDMERTQETAKVAYQQLLHPAPKLVIDKRLREKDFGEWEGLPNETIHARYKEKGLQGLAEMCPPGGETHKATMDRVADFFDDLCSCCDKITTSENIIIFTHGLWIVYLALYLTANPNITVELEGHSSLIEAFTKKGGAANTSTTQLTIQKLDASNKDNNNSSKRKVVFSTFLDKSHLSGL